MTEIASSWVLLQLAEEERIKQYRQAQKVKHGNRLIAASEQRDDALCSIEEQLARYAADLKSTTTKAKSPSKSPSKAKAPKSTDAAIGAFTEKLESLQLMDLQKVVPERIYSMAVVSLLSSSFTVVWVWVGGRRLILGCGYLAPFSYL